MTSSTVTLLQLNDSHAYLEPHSELFWSGDEPTFRTAGGFGRIAGLIRAAHAEHPGCVLALDCGDTVHGTYAAVATQGAALIPVLNAMQLQATTAHWEFAYGPQRWRELSQQLNYPMLACNCYQKGTQQLTFAPHAVYDLSGTRVGVIGIAATIVDKTMPPPFSEGIYLTLGRDELPAQIATVREQEGAQLVVVLSHLGFAQDLQLASDVPGIDVILSGHTHNRIYRPARVGHTLVIQSGCHGSFLGRLDLELDEHGIRDYAHRLQVVEASLPGDATVQALVDEAVGPYREMLAEVVGETAVPLHRNTILEAPMDNLLLHSLLAASDAEVAFSNGWRFGAPVPPGPLTLGDLYDIIPMDPPISTCALTGEEIVAMLEENLEHTFARNPYEQMGGYVKRCLGLNAYIKIENPAGRRIQELFIGGQPLQSERSYQAAYVTYQGVPRRYGRDHKNLDIHAVEAMRRYLGLNNPLRLTEERSFVAA